MLILKSIGAFFVRIWRWIKDTAWVQPLLIVGAVFAIIFSIPSLTNWISGLSSSGDGSYYESVKLTIDGEKYDEGVTLVSSDYTAADKIAEAVYKVAEDPDAESGNALEALKSQYGEKFFLIFVGNDCDACLSDEGGFETLRDDWKTNYVPSDGADLKIYAIDSDESSGNDEDYEKKDWDTAFKRYLSNWGDTFFDAVGQYLTDTSLVSGYGYNADISEDEYQMFQAASYEGEDIFTTPITLLVDFSAEAIEKGQSFEVVLTSLTGSSNIEKANFLLKMWNHLDDDRFNVFSTSYVK